MTKRKKIKDPNAAQEAQKYDKPIPSRDYILQYLEKAGKPISYDDLIHALGLHDDEEFEALRRRLIAMSRDGQVIRMRSEKYALPDKLDMVHGRVIVHPDGHGFLDVEGRDKDLFLSPKQIRSVFDGDTVLARIIRTDRRGRGEAVIIRVLTRKHQKIVGRYFEEAGIGFVVPDNKRIIHDIVIPKGEENGAAIGEMVVADITAQPTLRTEAVGRIAEVIGGHMDPGMEIDVAVRSHAIPHFWSDGVEAEAAAFPSEVQDHEIKSRKDLRDLPFVTIDGEDAKDFDDAVYCEKEKSGWKLYVAIADVSHYVKPGMALDEEALSRGNSVYFPSRVVPMLPEVLSNGLCSLRPKVDRLVLVCEMKVTAKGKLSRFEFYPATIHSQARLTYTEVAAMLVDQDEALQKHYQALMPHLNHLYSLYKALYRERQRNGAISFEAAEPQVVFDERMKIQSLKPMIRNDAHKIIEECMLLANVSAAEYLLKNKRPGLFRVHPGPKPDKLQDLMTFLGELGLGMAGGLEATPKDYADLLDQVEGRPDSHLIQMVLLRSLMQAHYSMKNEGHFGLAFDAYTHFTSPIRRYPDLMVHRAIYHILNKEKVTEAETKRLEHAATQCSMTERRADEAVYDVIGWLKCEYMMDKIGQEFKGVISGVTGFGIFVELEDVYVEGLIHVTSLDNDYYIFDPVRHRLTGERSGKIYCVGDQLNVRVVQVDLEKRRIDFELVQKAKKKKKKQTTPKAKKKAAKRK